MKSKVTYLQRRFKSAYRVRQTVMKVLQVRWDKLLGRIQAHASSIKDKYAIELVH